MGQAVCLSLTLCDLPLEARDKAGDSVAETAAGSTIVAESHEQRGNSRGRGKTVVDLALRFIRKQAHHQVLSLPYLWCLAWRSDRLLCWLSDVRLSAIGCCWAILTEWGYGEDVLEEIESTSRFVEFGDKDGGQALVLQ